MRLLMTTLAVDYNLSQQSINMILGFLFCRSLQGLYAILVLYNERIL